MNDSTPAAQSDGNYQVVALKYRPQSFGDLIGQDHIAMALSNAINQSRVGHAYLFTGARGVGKTSSARIFAKCLNCENGPSTTPCNECDICQAVSAGEDVDVLEIDGASNRGIDEIRSLRSNAAVRPSRCRYKIYIIDEVHMLTMPAFNALLKTLEEPPGHVKFIFCTTDPQKIPITVLSRCQRFDFSPVQTDQIAQSLREIADQEGVAADVEALALLARRANGSMRDSQSLLEQLFSFCDDRIDVEHVHQLLGTADVGRIGEIASAMVAKDPATTLSLIHQASHEGVNSGQLASQLLGYFRDAMAVRVGCGTDTLLTCTGSDLKSLTEISDQLGLETVLTIVQVLDSAVVKMQSSLHARILLEVAAMRVCNLENLDAIADLAKQIVAGNTGQSNAIRPSVSPPPSRKIELTKVTPSTTSKKNEIAEPLGAETLPIPQTDADGSIPVSYSATSELVDRNTGSMATAAAVAHPAHAPKASHLSSQPVVSLATTAAPTHDGSQVAMVIAPAASASIKSTHVTKATTDQSAAKSGPPLSQLELERLWGRMVEAMGDMTGEMAAGYETIEWSGGHVIATLKEPYHASECNRTERKQKIESTLQEISGRRIVVGFKVSEKSAVAENQSIPRLSRSQQMRKLQENEFIKQAMDLFTADIVSFYKGKPAASSKG
jgi:DNA polymerase-3 subunit gamma/tau